MKRIVAALKKRGIPENNTHWLSELILLQPIPNGNIAHVVGQPQPTEIAITGDVTGVVAGGPQEEKA